MNYFISTVIKGKSFDKVIESVKSELAGEGFGVPSEIDIQKTLKNKINVDFRKYRILGACNPEFAHRALQNERNIGVLLPCSIVVQEHEQGNIEVAAVEPVSSMMAVGNDEVQKVAGEISARLARVIKKIT